MHLYPLSSRSLFRDVYLIVFLKFAASKLLSKLQVSSIKYIVLESLSSSTKSGLDWVTRTSGGIVPPLVSKCPLCSNHGTLEHILNFCSISLNQGRFTWRHNTVLSHITNTIVQNKPENIEVYSDISGHHWGGQFHQMSW